MQVGNGISKGGRTIWAEAYEAQRMLQTIRRVPTFRKIGKVNLFISTCP